MPKYSPKRRVLAALMGGKVDRVPATCIGACGGSVSTEIQETVGIYWPNAFKDPQKMANLAIASQKITGLENVNVGHEFSILPEALGCEIKWYDRRDLKPAMISHPFENPKDLKMPNDLLERGRIPAIMEAIYMLRKEVGDFLPITSFVFGPYSLAGELAEPKRFMMWSIRKPEDAKKYIDLAVEVIIEYAKAQYRAGSDIVSLGEPLGTPDKAGPQVFEVLIKPALKEIAKNLDGIRVLHLCGDVESFIPEMVDIGFDAISVKQSVDIARIKPIVGDVTILGNIESKGVLTHGTPDEVRIIAKKALESGVDLLEPGCGIEPAMPINNIKVLAEEVRKFKING
ncbi:MAG: MtaA/CmuA family methyltransferase [Candidatus Methylarchaceae archaeon HK02M2]|nr:MtaA/CmuA family methyltransferase [Candidatus Methylarchaceae archaeon HK02M2]